jgi:hypothetical protein
VEGDDALEAIVGVCSIRRMSYNKKHSRPQDYNLVAKFYNTVDDNP